MNIDKKIFDSHGEIMGVILNSIRGGTKDALMTVEEGEELFYKTHTCLYDDHDKEQARIKNWFEANNIIITD